jgi:hypothetical protein
MGFAFFVAYDFPTNHQIKEGSEHPQRDGETLDFAFIALHHLLIRFRVLNARVSVAGPLPPAAAQAGKLPGGSDFHSFTKRNRGESC